MEAIYGQLLAKQSEVPIHRECERLVDTVHHNLLSAVNNTHLQSAFFSLRNCLCLYGLNQNELKKTKKTYRNGNF